MIYFQCSIPSKKGKYKLINQCQAIETDLKSVHLKDLSICIVNFKALMMVSSLIRILTIFFSFYHLVSVTMTHFINGSKQAFILKNHQNQIHQQDQEENLKLKNKIALNSIIYHNKTKYQTLEKTNYKIYKDSLKLQLSHNRILIMKNNKEDRKNLASLEDNS